MKRLAKLIVLILFILFCTACVKVRTITNEYMTIFDDILTEHSEQVDGLDYISIYIDDKQLSAHELNHIQERLGQGYDKQVYTYTKDEVHVAGPYGKEKLKDQGVFLYIRHIEHMDEGVWMTIEMHDTRGTFPSIIREKHIKKKAWPPMRDHASIFYICSFNSSRRA